MANEAARDESDKAAWSIQSLERRMSDADEGDESSPLSLEDLKALKAGLPQVVALVEHRRAFLLQEIARLDGITPPPKLRAFHDAIRAAWQAEAEAVPEIPPAIRKAADTLDTWRTSLLRPEMFFTHKFLKTLWATSSQPIPSCLTKESLPPPT